MEEELNDLLVQAREHISDNVDKQNAETYLFVLEESLKEVVKLKDLTDEFIDVRNKAIKNLYDLGYSAIQLAEITNLTRQMVHNIVKGK